MKQVYGLVYGVALAGELSLHSYSWFQAIYYGSCFSVTHLWTSPGPKGAAPVFPEPLCGDQPRRALPIRCWVLTPCGQVLSQLMWLECRWRLPWQSAALQPERVQVDFQIP